MAWTPIRLRFRSGLVAFDGEAEGAGGGSQPGAVRVRKFAVAFDSAGLYTAAGFPLFTTAAGEQILDTWFEGDVDWDAGTTPLMDVASAAELGNGEGWWVANGSTPPPVLLLIASSINAYNDSRVYTFATLNAAQITAAANALPRVYAAPTAIVAVSWDDDSVSESAPAPYGAMAGALDLYVVSSVPA